MSVRLDKTRPDLKTGCVDDPCAVCGKIFPDRGDLSVLNGNIQGFLDAYLEWLAGKYVNYSSSDDEK